MQCSISTFRIRTGLGTQTVTGIADKNGNAFTPEYLWFINSSSELNVFYSNGSGTYNTSTYNSNFYRVSDGAAGYAATGHLPQFGAKIGSGAGGTGTNCALDSLEADAFFGGNVYRTCRINSVSSGQFEIEVITTTAWAFATDVIVIALANAGDLYFDNPAFLGTTGTHTTAGTPKAILNAYGAGYLGTGSPGNPATGAGGANFGIGWDTPNGGPMHTATHLVNQGGNYRYQRTNYWSVGLSGAGAAVNGPIVTSWNPSSVTVDASAGSGDGAGTVAICGNTVVASSGTFTQPLTTGTQTITTGINAAMIVVASNGLPSSTSVDSTFGEMAMGWFNGTSQATYWGGERRVGNTLPLYGGCYVGDTEGLRFVETGTGPNGASTTFNTSMELVSLSETGSFTVNWTAVDGVQREILWFALGTEALASGSVEFTKVWEEPITGSVTLQIGTTPGGDDVGTQVTGEEGGTPLTLGPVSLAEGTYYVSESPSHIYSYTLTGTKNGVDIVFGADNSFTVANEDVITITISNAAVIPPERPKQWKLYSFSMKLRKEERA